MKNRRLLIRITLVIVFTSLLWTLNSSIDLPRASTTPSDKERDLDPVPQTLTDSVSLSEKIDLAIKAYEESDPIIVDDIISDANINEGSTIKNDTKIQDMEDISEIELVSTPPAPLKQITISAVGDCTLGTDENFAYKNSFIEVFENNNKDYNYFFKHVYDIFNSDSLTIANLETTLTTATKKRDKAFKFKGPPDFVNILTQSSIEAVNLSNNHTYDYFKKGYEDTKAVLDNNDVTHFSNKPSIYTKDGIKIGLIGYNGWYINSKLKNEITTTIETLHEQDCSLIIVSFHWGKEYTFYPNSTQRNLARHAIDSGADLVLGHHPHVIQGIEKYKNRHIVYSLGNFCFGGNSNPRDKDTMIYQQTFNFEDKSLVGPSIPSIIPCSLSSVKNRNNYQPIPLVDDDADRMISRLNKYSKDMNFNYQPVTAEEKQYLNYAYNKMHSLENIIPY